MENINGRTLGGRYILEEMVGKGGMAVVYKARDTMKSRTVAVKIMKEKYSSNEEYRQRFLTESRAAASLNNPNIVKIYDVSLGMTTPYIVMEYVDGITLKDYLKKKVSLSWREAFAICTQVLNALDHAHNNGVIHRDIKPQNIMLLNDMKTVKVMDFGIALYTGNRYSSGEMDNVPMGSVGYVSPEQIQGRRTDSRADIYSVGVTMYEIVTGKMPFTSDSAVNIARKQITSNPISPKSLVPDLPTGVDQIIMKAMSINPTDRYQSAREMLAEMAEVYKNPLIVFDHTRKKTAAVSDKRNHDFSNSRLKGVSSFGDVRSRQPQIKTGVSIMDGSSPSSDKDGGIEIDWDKVDMTPQDEAYSKKDITVPILFIIIFVLIAVSVFAAWFFFADTKEVSVPDFVGKNINEVKNEKDYKYFFSHDMIEQNLVYTTDHEEGYIISQSVKKGTVLKVTHSSKTVIRLNVAYTSKSMTVPEISKGEQLSEARQKLQKLGFKVKTKAQVDMSLDESTVIKVDPASGTEVSYGSTVTIYYAIHDADKVAVPDVVGVEESDAVQELKDLGFNVKVEYQESSGTNVGKVISQSVKADTQVIAANTQVTLVVGRSSSGGKVFVSVSLPDLSSKDNAVENIYVYVNGSLYKTYSSVSLDGSSKSVELGGSGKSTFEVQIGDQVVMTGDVDFNSSEVSNTTKKSYKYSENAETTKAETTKKTETTAATTKAPETTTQGTVSRPSYFGKTGTEYYNELVNLGFDVEIIRQASSSVPEGNIIGVQGPQTVKKSEVENTHIVIFVSSGS